MLFRPSTSLTYSDPNSPLKLERSQSARSVVSDDRSGFFGAAYNRKRMSPEESMSPIEQLQAEIKRLSSDEDDDAVTKVVNSETQLLGKWFDLV